MDEYEAGRRHGQIIGNLIDGLVCRREEAGLKRSEVAELLGVSRDEIREFERLSGDPKISMVLRYADAVGTSVHFALGLTSIPAGFLDDEDAEEFAAKLKNFADD